MSFPPYFKNHKLVQRLAEHVAISAARKVRENPFLGTISVTPLRVAAGIEQNDDAPLVRSHYRTINPTTGISAPVPRIGTRTLTATDRLGFSLRIGTTGSCVPYRSLS